MIFKNDITYAKKLDQTDPLRYYREQFHIPSINGQECIYLCGNSLGLQPKTIKEKVINELDNWAVYGVEGHVKGKKPWLPYHEFLTQSMARLVGAKPQEVVVMNSLTVNLHLLFVSFYMPTKSKYKVVIEQDAFPSDRYVVSSQVKFHGYDPNDAIIVWKSRAGEACPRMEDLEKIMDEHGDEVALVFIGGVNYYTGQYFDIKKIASIGHAKNAIVGIDLAHAAGNINLNLSDSNIDFGAWCGYKYLNSGPGGMSGVFINERYAAAKGLNRFTGWWGHNKETRFKMRGDFDPIPGAEGWQLSNPPILPMAALKASLEIFDEVGMDALRAKSEKMTSFLISILDEVAADKIEIITPRNIEERGSQISLLVKKDGKALFDELTKLGIVADWREPNVIRVAPIPLYNSYEEIWQFANILGNH